MIKIEVGRKEDDLQELLRSKEPSSFDNSKQFAILKLTDGCLSRVNTTAKQQTSELINIEFSFVFLSFTELRFAKLCYILFSYYQLIAAQHTTSTSLRVLSHARPPDLWGIMILLLVCLSLAALVSGLLDGGDFVSNLDGGQKVTISQEAIVSHHGLCPAITLHTLVSEIFTCSSVPQEKPFIGIKERNRETVTYINDDIEQKKEIPQTQRANDQTKEDSEAGKLPPSVIIPPLIVRATPKEMTSSTTVSPVKTTVTKEELEPQTETKAEVTEPGAGGEKAQAEFGRKESSVEEEPVQPDQSEQPDVMVPFNQWAEKKLEEAAMKDATKKDEPEVESERGASTKPSSTGHNAKSNGAFKMSKNFASPDCSAKIVGANSGSQGSGNVITSSRDEYFLNKCSQKAWFVVELCESIKAVKIQLANFELYSSSPNEFKVFVANVYPGRDKDWVEFGTFSYSDERNIQTFVAEVGVVGKYVKVEVLSHHGSEHYCPVSLFKVFGIPEIDLISEDDHEEDGSDETPDVSSEDEPKHHPIVQTIKDAVHQVVNVFRPQNVSIVETLNTSSLQGASLRYKLRPESGDKYDQEVINRYHMIYYLLATQYSRVRHYSRIMNVHLVLPLVCPEFGIELQSREQAGVQRYPWQFLHFVRLFHGEDFLVALCNLESMEQGQSSLVSRAKAASPPVAASNRTAGTAVADNQTQQVSEAGGEVAGPPVVTERDARTENVSSPHPADQQADTALEAAGSETEAAQSAPALELKPPEPSKPVTASQPAGQTTWQKLSSRSGLSSINKLNHQTSAYFQDQSAGEERDPEHGLPGGAQSEVHQADRGAQHGCEGGQ